MWIGYVDILEKHALNLNLNAKVKAAGVSSVIRARPVVKHSCDRCVMLHFVTLFECDGTCDLS
jgi:hypothetical protein